MLRAICCFLLLAACLHVAQACFGKPSYGPQNLNPIFEATEGMTLLNSVPNGKLYLVEVPNPGFTPTNFTVLHLYGTPTDWGTAQGQLLGPQLTDFLNSVWQYLEQQITSTLPPYFPKWFSDLVAEVGLDAALDATYYASVEFTNPDIYTELQAMTNAAGGDSALYWTAVKVHMIAGLTEGACSMFGAWGDAVSDGPAAGHVLQLRALDWNTDGPFRDYSQITVYHPAPTYGYAFANIGFSGFVGSITGINEVQLGISEIGASYPDASFGDMSRIGLPFIFVLRDLIQYAYTVDDATNWLINTRRTCDLMLGVGDGKLGYFHGYEYSYSVLNVFDPLNQMPYNESANPQWHPRIPDIVYWGMDWLCPSDNLVLSQQLMADYGRLTPQLAIMNVTAVEQSGDSHIAYYDLTSMELWVAFEAPTGATGPLPGYARQFTHFNATALFQEPAPTGPRPQRHH